MKILIVNTYYYPNMIGGTEQSIKLLAEGLKGQGHDVYVLTGDQGEKAFEEINGINIIRLDLNRKKSYIKKIIRKGLEFNNLAIKNKIVEILEEIKPDVVHTNNLFYISPIIWKIAKEKNIKVVHTLRDYWGVCPKTSLLDRRMNICQNKKLLCKIHTSNYLRFSKYVDIVTAPSNFTLNIYSDEGLFKNAKKTMVPNAIDINLIEHLKCIEERNKYDSDEIRYLFIGSLHEHKGIEYLIDTFKSIDNKKLRLTICGDGPLKHRIEESIKSDKRISYLGTVFNDKKKEVLMKSDVMIVPSIWYEPFGRVVIEAYKYGLPVIACKIGGINELLNEDTSIGVEINNKDDLKSAILALNNREHIKECIKNMIKYIDIYDIDKQVGSFVEIYKSN